MEGRPNFKQEGESSQEVVERVAQITDILFRAPHFVFSYGLILLLPMLIVPLFWRELVATPGDSVWYAYRNAFVVFTIPGILAAASAWRLARVYGGTFDRRRSAFLALSAEFFLLVIVTVGGLLYRRGNYSFYDPIIIGYAFTVVIHQVALFTTSDHRQIRSAQVALLQPASGILLLHLIFETDAPHIALSVTLPLAFLAITIYFLDLVDAPIKRNTGLSLSEMFRHFLDHLARGTLKGEEMMLKIAGEIEAHVAVVGLRRLGGGGLKAAIVVPAVHPGPIGHLGGSNLPAKVTQAVGVSENILVPHGPATHDFNPASHVEVERIGEAARQLLHSIQYSDIASPLVRVGTDVQVCSQYFGDSVLLTYTSWPKPIDDVDYGVGDAAMWSAKYAGAQDAAFIDAHNSLLLGSGAVYPSDRRAVSIIETAGLSAKAALSQRTQGVRAGYAQNKDAFGRGEGIGEQGCQVLVLEVASRKSAYILWDGNNMLPEVRSRIRERLENLVEDFEVMTTDNHSVNIVAGGYNPVGYRADLDKIASVTRTTLERALMDLEPVEVGMKTGRIPGLKVLGHWNTIRLVSAVHTIVSLIPRATVAFLMMLLLTTILTLVWVNTYY